MRRREAGGGKTAAHWKGDSTLGWTPGDSHPRRGLGAIHPGVSDHGGTPTLGTYLSWLKASHFVYLRWVKMVLKWLKLG